MAQKVQLPDGTLFPMKEGETPEQALLAAASLYPDAFTPKKQEAPPQSGGIAALKSNISSLKGDVAALLGRTGVMDQEAAERYIAEQKKYQAKTFKPTEEGWTEAPLTKFFELLGGSAAYMAAPLVAGAAAATLPVSAPVAAAVGAGAAGLASFGQFTGSFLSRQMETGKKLGETELGAATLAALPAAVLDTVSMRMIPGIRNILGAAGRKVTDAEARAIAQQGLGRTLGDYVVKTGTVAGTEGLTESAQQFLERLQAGLSITDKEARDEYFDSFVGGAVLGGTLSVPGRFYERGKIKGQAEAADAKEKEAARAAAAQEQQAAAAEEAARRNTPEYFREAIAQYDALEQQKAALQAQIARAPKGEKLNEAQKQANKDIYDQLSALAPDLKEAARERNRVMPLLAQAQEQERVQAMSPEEFAMEQALAGEGMQLPKGGRFTTVEPTVAAPAPQPSRAEIYGNEQIQQAKEVGALSSSDLIDYLAANPTFAYELLRNRPQLTNVDGKPFKPRELDTLYTALKLRLQAEGKQELEARAADLKAQLPVKLVGQRKAPDYDAYLNALDELDFVRREGQTEADVREMEGLARPTGVTDQGELFGQADQRTVLGQAPKTRRELLSDLRIARAAGDRNAASQVIEDLRSLEEREQASEQRQPAGGKFVLTGEQRQRMFESGYTEEQIDEAESLAQKSLGQNLGAGQTPMLVALQQMASENRSDAFAEIVDLINRYNKGAAKREELNAAQERLISGLITDIQQTRGKPLTEEESASVTRETNALLRDLIERFGDTRNLSQKGGDLFVPAQTKTGEFNTNEVPGKGFPTVESRAPGSQTFGSPYAAVQSIREGIEQLRTSAISGDATTFTRRVTPATVSAQEVERQLARELAKDPKSHSTEQRRILEAIGDNLRMMLRGETRQDVSDWLYDLARDADNVSPERTQAVRDALNAVEAAKRSETELETREFVQGTGTRVNRAEQAELPLGPGRELRRTELEGPQKTAEAGTFSQIGTTPEYEAATSRIFNSYAELERYLASDALQQIRSAIGLGRPTLARLQARVQPFMVKINAAKAKADELSKQAQDIETRKRQELETLKSMTAKDMAEETRALNQARQTLEAAKKRLAELEAPLRKELEPLIQDFESAKQQFEEAVTAQEQTTALMLRNRTVFETREIAAIEALERVQRRIKLARSKLYAEITADFGADPRNLARMMKEYKESGKQGAFAEQLRKAHAELDKVFFDTRKDDAAIKRFLQESLKLDLQIEAQGTAIDAAAEKLLNAGLGLEVVRNSQVDIAENKDEILDARNTTQEAQRRLAALEAKQQERIAALRKMEDALGLDRQQITHRISEDTTVAEVLRASTDSEKVLIQQLEAALAEANESSPAVRALRAFDRNRERARAAKRETSEQTQARDTQRLRLLEAVGRDPASFEGQRISTEKRRELADELEATEATRANLEAVIAAVDESIPGVKERIAKAEKELKTLDAEIAQLEALAKKKPRGFYAKLEQQSKLTPLPFLKESRAKFAKGIEQMNADIAAYEQEKATAQSNLATLEKRDDDLVALFSNDPEIRNAAVAAIDKRIAKVETNIKNNAAGLQEKGISKTTRESRERELRKYKKELRELMTKRSAKFGIQRTELADTGRVATQTAEEGTRLVAPKKGALVRPKRTAGNVRTGELGTAEERQLSTRSKITQGGQAKTLPPIPPVPEAATVEDRITGEMDALEAVRQRVETRILDAQAANDRVGETAARETLARIDAQVSKKREELAAAAKAPKPKKRTEAAGPVEPTVYGAKEAPKFEKPEYLSVATLPEKLVPSVSKLLNNAELQTLEQVYKAQRGTDKFNNAIKQDVVNYINSGPQSLARDARALIKTIANNAGLQERKLEFSRGAAAKGQTVAQLESSLDQALGEKGLAARRIKLFSSVEEFFASKAAYDYEGADIPSDAKAFVNPKNGDVFMFADNIGKDEAVGVLLHEVGVHIGFRKLFSPAKFNALVQSVKNWASRNDGSLESKIAQRALARVEAAETTAEQFDDELLAYSVEEAVKAGVQPSALKNGKPVQNWLQLVLDTLRKALSAFGINPAKLTSGDLVNMAYGAAQLEVRGTWHGSDAKFTAFDVKKAGAGEGAFDRRFDETNNLGPGPYTTPQQSYAEYYQYAVPFGKAANATGYGDRSYQDYRALDERFMLANNAELTPDELQAKFESRLLNAYLRGVSAGESLTPEQNTSAQKLLEKLTTSARTAEEKAAVATLSLANLRGLSERPPVGTLYRALDDMPRAQIYEVNAMHTVGERPKIDALLKKYGNEYDVAQANDEGRYAGNGLFFNMRRKLGIAKTLQLLKKAGINAIEQNAERRYIERAYIEQAPELIALDEKPIGPASGLLFSKATPQYESENALTALANKVIAQPRGFMERVGNNKALQTEMYMVDMRAGLREALKAGAAEMGNDKLFTQAMYNVIKADQKMPLVYASLQNGALETYTDDKGFVGIRSSGKNSPKEMFKAIADLPGNPQARYAIATTYMIAQRAANKGLSKLDLGALGVTEADLANAMAAANADPELKAKLERVRRIYNAYNEGQINFLVSMGAISKKEAAVLLKDGDYVPYYRVRDDGNAELVLGAGKTITVGDVRYQPQLAALKGGETKILPLNESVPLNTMLLTTKALTNGAAKNIGYALQTFGEGKGQINPRTGKPGNAMPIHAGDGPAGPDIIRFNQEPDPKDPKDDGKRWLRVKTAGTALEGIPAELVVKSLEGSHLTLPTFLKIGGVFSDFLRKGVTRMPPYILRQLVRDPMAASFTAGLNYNPLKAVAKAGSQFIKDSVGSTQASAKLIEKGLVQSGIFTGDPDDLSAFALQLASGKDMGASDKLFGMLDRAAMRADAATRALVYENALKNGLSEVEADFMVMESMNFYKRGLSPTVQYAARLIPFLNAQIQGLNVLAKAMRGNMPFNESLKIQRKFFNNGMLLFATGMAYAMAMEDDETFKNAKLRDKYSNLFLPIPGLDEPLKLPIPYEAGWFFSAAVAMADAMKEEVDGKQQLKAIKEMVVGSIPGASSNWVPQIVKPAFEVWTNKNFMTGGDIESVGMQQRSIEARYNSTTTEAAKQLSKLFPVLSPIQIEHLARGYFGLPPLLVLQGTSAVMRGEDKGAAPEGRTSDLPVVGSMFQKTYGGADTDAAYALAKKATEASGTYNDMRRKGQRTEAAEYVNENKAEIRMASAARTFQDNMGKITTQIEIVKGRKDLSAKEKRERIDSLEKVRDQIATQFRKQFRAAEAGA